MDGSLTQQNKVHASPQRRHYETQSVVWGGESVNARRGQVPRALTDGYPPNGDMRGLLAASRASRAAGIDLKVTTLPGGYLKGKGISQSRTFLLSYSLIFPTVLTPTPTYKSTFVYIHFRKQSLQTLVHK